MADHDKYDDIKRKIRKLKKLEIKIRFPNSCDAEQKQGDFVQPGRAGLVWDEFFDLHEAGLKKARY